MIFLGGSVAPFHCFFYISHLAFCAIIQHERELVLSLGMILIGSLPEPLDRRRRISPKIAVFVVIAVTVQECESVSSIGMILVGSLPEPLDRRGRTSPEFTISVIVAITVQECEFVLSIDMIPALGGLLKPSHRLVVVFLYATAFEVHKPEVILRVGAATLGVF